MLEHNGWRDFVETNPCVANPKNLINDVSLISFSYDSEISLVRWDMKD